MISAARRTALTGIGSRWARVLLIVGVCSFAVFPFYWMFMSSVVTGPGQFVYPPRFLPNDWEFSAYRAVFAERDISRWLWNTTVVAILSTLLALAVGTPGAFALARFRYRGKQVFAFSILTTQMLPPLILIIPLFRIFVIVDWIDSLLALVVANFIFSLPVVTWLMKAVFESIPAEIEEAARVDGASWFTVLLRVTGPLALPGLAATGIFAFLEVWDEYLFARTVVTSPENWIASIGLASFFDVAQTPWAQIMAAAFIFSLPPVVLFLLIQRYFVAGLGAGAVKG